MLDDIIIHQPVALMPINLIALLQSPYSNIYILEQGI